MLLILFNPANSAPVGTITGSGGQELFPLEQSGTGSVHAAPPPGNVPGRQGGGFPVGNLVDLVLGKNLARGKPYRHATRITYRLRVTTKITILGGARDRPRVIRRRRIAQPVCPVPIEVLMEIDEDLAVCEMARRSRV